MKKLIGIILMIVLMVFLISCNDEVTHQDVFNEINVIYEQGDKNNVKGNFEFFYDDLEGVEVLFESLNENILKINGNKVNVTQGYVNENVFVKVYITINETVKEFTFEFVVIKEANITPPIISGTKDFVYTIGDEKPDYLAGVSGVGHFLENIIVTVDDSLVDLEVAGIYDIFYKAFDVIGNETKVTQKVTVVVKDKLPPVITGAKDFNYIVGDPTPNYLEGVTAIDDVDGIISVSVDASLVDLTTEGTYPIYYSATDLAGNETKIKKEVFVSKPDTTPPVISGAQDLTHVIGDDAPNYLNGVTATDNVDGAIVVEVQTPFVNLFKTGVYSIFYIATDLSGNRSIIEKTITVTEPAFVDTTPPVISGTKDFIYLIGDPNPNYLAGVTATDDVDGTVFVSVDDSLVDLSTEGSYPVYYSATDSSGNTSTIEITITVTEPALVDIIPPVISGTKDFIYIVGNPTPNYLAGVTAIDGVDGVISVSVDDSLADLSVEGSYPIYYSATDLAGNKTTIEVEIKVIDSGGVAETFTETFANLPTTGSSYSDADFTGVNGVFWSYNEARTDQDLDGKALTFHNKASAVLSATLDTGIAYFSIQAAHAFSGSTVRDIALYIDGTEVEVFGVASGAAQTFTIDNLSYQGEVLLEIRNVGANRVTIDNLTIGFNNKTVEEKYLDAVADSLTMQTIFINNGDIDLPNNVSGVNIIWEFNDISDPNNQYVNLSTGEVTIPLEDVVLDVYIKASLSYEEYLKEKIFILKVGEGEPLSIAAVKKTTNGTHVKTKGVVTSSVLKSGIYYVFIEDNNSGIYLESNVELTVGKEVIFKAVKGISNGVITLTDINDVKVVAGKTASVSIIKLNQLNSYLGRYVSVTGYLTSNTILNQTEYNIASKDAKIKVVLPHYINPANIQNELMNKEAGIKVSLEGYVYNNSVIYLISDINLYIEDDVDHEEVSDIIEDSLQMPKNNEQVLKNLILPTTDTLFNSTIQWMSSNSSIISDTGKFTEPEEDTNVTLYYQIYLGSKKIKDGQIIVVAKANISIGDIDYTAFGNYYSSLKNLTGDAFNNALKNIISNVGGDYGSTSQVKEADKWGSSYYLIYDGQGSYGNREHVWPDSKLGSNPSYNLHNLRAANTSTNSKRSNYPFGEDGNPFTGSQPWQLIGQTFYPGDEHIGDVARIVFYISIRYGLSLNVVGNLNMFLTWHELDPVNDFERTRNGRIHDIQNNRNPFIDYPQLVNVLFGNAPTSSNNTYSYSQEKIIYTPQSLYEDRRSYLN